MAADLHSGSPGNYNLFIATSEAKSGQGAPHEIYTSLINISLIFIIYFFLPVAFLYEPEEDKRIDAGHWDVNIRLETENEEHLGISWEYERYRRNEWACIELGL